MPSWKDGESSPEMLSDLTDMDYAPDTFEDPTFCGLAAGYDKICRVHRLEPTKCVAFEGTDTGRRFYMCQVQNQVSNCGFVSWLDGEYHDTLKNALKKLWGMYYSSNSARIEDKIVHARFVEQLSEEKKSIEKKYSSLLADVNKFMSETEKQVMEKNLAGMNAASKEEDKMAGMEKEINMLKKQVARMKDEQKSVVEQMNSRQKNWEQEKDALKEEKKMLEYNLFDLLKVSDGNKNRLLKIRQIFDE